METITNNKYFNFGKGINNLNKDFRIITSSTRCSEYDLLIFTDSKGTSIGKEIGKEWTTLLLKEFEKKGISYLFISRPKEITVFMTLINFLMLNSIKFNSLITNLGFVDLTPKKREFVLDIIEQAPQDFKDQLSIIDLCNYELSSGTITKLSTVNYNNIIGALSMRISENFQNAFLLGTFEFTPEINITRKRPIEFYSQLRETNKFINKICEFSSNLKYISVLGDWLKNGEEISYDAVHFTESGHKLVFSLVEKELGL